MYRIVRIVHLTDVTKLWKLWTGRGQFFKLTIVHRKLQLQILEKASLSALMKYI